MTEPKRPYANPHAKRRNIYADEQTMEALRRLGKGSASEGIREALRIATQPR